MPAPRWKPQACTDAPSPALLTNQYRRTVTSGGFQTVQDTMAPMALLPGIPDTLEIQILDNPAVISVTDEQGRDAREITLSASTSTDTITRDRLIKARNLVAGNVARLQFIARYL